MRKESTTIQKCNSRLTALGLNSDAAFHRSRLILKQFIYRFNSTEKELLEELNIERSVFYDRKREAIYLFSVCLFGYSIPEVLEELPRLNPD